MSDLKNAYQLLQNKTKVIKKPKKKRQLNEKKTIEETVKQFRERNSIKCYSKTSEIVDPIKTIEDIFCKYPIFSCLRKSIESMKYDSLTPIQMQAIPIMIDRHNVVSLAPTGSGKTFAFLLPVLYGLLTNNRKDSKVKESPYAIIISPTLELCKQIFQELLCLLNEYDVNNFKERIQFVNKKTKSIKENIDIIIGTPLKVKKLMDSKKDNCKINVTQLHWLIIDESDKMMDDGLNGFYDQINSLYKRCSTSKYLKTALFSATQTDDVWNWVNENMADDLIYIRIGAKNAAADTVKQTLRYCMNDNMKLSEMKLLFNSGSLKCPCLIFMDRSVHAKYLYEILSEYGSKVHATVELISGNLSDEERRQAIINFREGKTHFLICTNLIARGLDFKGVSTVINYDLPKSSEDYIHRIGRCGRAGEYGEAISLWTDADASNGLSDIIKVLKASNQDVNEELVEFVKKQPRAKYANKKLNAFKRKFSQVEWDNNKLPYEAKKKKMYLEKCVSRTNALKNQCPITKKD